MLIASINEWKWVLSAKLFDCFRNSLANISVDLKCVKHHYFDVEISNTTFNVAYFVQNPVISFQKINNFHKYYEIKVRQLTENIHNNICKRTWNHQNYDDIIFKSNQQRFQRCLHVMLWLLVIVSKQIENSTIKHICYTLKARIRHIIHINAESKCASACWTYQ